MKNINIKISFSEELMQDKEFIKEFRNNIDYQVYYLKLKEHFGKQEFFLSDKRVLDKGFIKAISGKGNYKYSKNLDIYFDAIFEPGNSKSSLLPEQIEEIQTLVFDIYEKYGRKGLNDTRNISLSQAMIDKMNYILIKDDQDEYDLDIVDELSNTKILVLNNEKYNFKQRVFDILKCKLFINYLNDNVKSALFNFPQLLYDENNELIDELEMLEMLTRISNLLPANSFELDDDLYSIAIEECKNIYLEKHNDLIPKKKKEKVKKIK